MMGVPFIFRRAHPRRLRCGRIVDISQAFFPSKVNSSKKNSSYRHPCPECGSQIISVAMTKGGYAHFEGGVGLGRIKHPCLHIGERIGTRRDSRTYDMFEID